MKARIITSVMAVALTGIFLTALALSGSEPAAPQVPEPPAEAEALLDADTADDTVAVDEGFWVCESDGVITVFHNTERNVPIKTTSTAVHTLRLADQEMLRSGVFFDNYLDAMSFLEDFAP